MFSVEYGEQAFTIRLPGHTKIICFILKYGERILFVLHYFKNDEFDVHC